MKASNKVLKNAGLITEAIDDTEDYLDAQNRIEDAIDELTGVENALDMVKTRLDQAIRELPDGASGKHSKQIQTLISAVDKLDTQATAVGKKFDKVWRALK